MSFQGGMGSLWTSGYPQLFESELFGCTEDSFSGAAKGRRIRFLELAQKSTIFFDEIGRQIIDAYRSWMGDP